ncbi:MAG: hypothetical protein WCT99_08290, partial [Bacteroidota bacterium]
MNKYLINLVIIIDIFIVTFLVSQQQSYPYLKSVQINASISSNRNEQIFYYTYTIKNGETNLGKIAGFEIDISRSPNDLEIDTLGLKFENDGFIEASFRRHFPFLKGKIIPVGLFASPGDIYGFTWTGGYSNNLTAGWGADSVLIEPDQRLSGFVLMSKGLPGIRQCTVSPFFDVIALFPDPADTTITYYVPPVDSVRLAVKFHGVTIGPTAPPLNFVATVFLDTLLSYTHQSVTLGWLKTKRDDDREGDERSNDGIVRNIEKRIEKAKKELVKGDSVKARQELEKLVKKVEKL